MTPEPTQLPEPSDISQLLLRWRDRREQGQPCTPEQLCPERPELHEELRQQIAAIESMEGRLGPRFRTTMATPMTSGAPPLAVVPGYEVLEELGRGGMGVVYKARQIGLNRLVALKMILSGTHAGRLHRQRFQAEAEALARLHHPNIVQVYEFGEANGLPYLSLEFVEGGSLDKVIGQALPPVEAAQLIELLARAVGAAHAAGIVHRDLKPANVLLEEGLSQRRKGAKEEQEEKNKRQKDSSSCSSFAPLRLCESPSLLPKITDFGLAKMLDGESRTQSGDILGTPCYMAPEQAEGRIKDVGPAADVYALGAILYECLTGSPPFQGESAIGVLRQVTTQEPVPPSKLRPRLPRDLETISLKCLEKVPERRYASADALADDLRNFLDGRPIAARPAGWLERGVKWSRRRPERALLTLLLLVVPLLVAVFWPREQPDPHLAENTRAVFVKYCFHCHGYDPNKIEGKLIILDRAHLLDPRRRIVVPGDPAESHLITRIEDDSMPPAEDEEHPRLGNRERELIQKWVKAGAPAFRPIEAADRTPPVVAPLARQIHELFQRRCHECHKLSEAKAGIKILNHDLLVAKRKLVVPGAPLESSLFRVLISPDEKKRMPPKLPLSEADTALVRRWIEEGALPFPLPEK